MSERPNDAADDPADEPEVADEPEEIDEPEVIDPDDRRVTPDGDIIDLDAGTGGTPPDLDLAAEDEPRRPMRPSERRALRAAGEHETFHVDPALRIRDRASAVFVLVSVIVFVGILLNGLVLGHGGLLTATPSPSPRPSITAAPSVTPAASPSPTAAPTPTTVPTAAPTPSPAPS